MSDITPRDDAARAGLAERAAFPAPVDGFVEHVFRHELTATDAPEVSASIINPAFEPTGGIGLTVSWDPRQLPRMWQWRMLGPGMYLTRLEPADCDLAGRAAEREAGDVRVVVEEEVLDPGITECGRSDLRQVRTVVIAVAASAFLGPLEAAVQTAARRELFADRGVAFPAGVGHRVRAAVPVARLAAGLQVLDPFVDRVQRAGRRAFLGFPEDDDADSDERREGQEVAEEIHCGPPGQPSSTDQSMSAKRTAVYTWTPVSRTISSASQRCR